MRFGEAWLFMTFADVWVSLCVSRFSFLFVIEIVNASERGEVRRGLLMIREELCDV